MKIEVEVNAKKIARDYLREMAEKFLRSYELWEMETDWENLMTIEAAIDVLDKQEA